MATVSAPPAVGQRLLLYNVDWQTYTRLLRIFAEHPSVRLAYDRGTLEIMSPLPEHEKDADFLGVLVRSLTRELGLTIQGGGSMTMRRRRKQKGIEPDRCYWIANEPAVRGKRTFDPRIDPPPDLAIEVDVTSSSLNRMGIYATLGVPEVWRLDQPTLTFHALGANRKYSAITHSLSFPLVTPADLLNFLALRATLDENGVLDQFETWVRQRRAAGGAAPPTP
ncbi:MAG TPA: Uma2 family endonuclease [Gemmataceae bacterium]|jgi:Uma2 family endonuclease